MVCWREVVAPATQPPRPARVRGRLKPRRFRRWSHPASHRSYPPERARGCSSFARSATPDPPRRQISSSAAMLNAISSGVSARRSSPMGACTRASVSRRHPVAQEVAEDRAHLAGAADHADIARRRIQRRAQHLLVRAMPACNDHDGGHGIGAALRRSLGHLADERLHALRQRRRAHELRAVVQQCHAPAQWDARAAPAPERHSRSQPPSAVALGVAARRRPPASRRNCRRSRQNLGRDGRSASLARRMPAPARHRRGHGRRSGATERSSEGAVSAHKQLRAGPTGSRAVDLHHRQQRTGSPRASAAAISANIAHLLSDPGPRPMLPYV